MIGRTAFITATALAVVAVGPAFAELEVYWTKDPASANTAPPGGNWVAGALPGSLPNDSLDIWLAVNNDPDPLRRKFLHILIEGAGLAYFSTANNPEGFETTDTSQPVVIRGAGGGVNHAERYDLNWMFEKQPRWERIRLFGTSSDLPPLIWDNVKIASICSDSYYEDPFLHLDDSSLDAPGASSGTPQWTELWIFPLPGLGIALPSFTAPPSTGNWSNTIVFTDPDGNPRPGGGVKFMSDGAGLTNADAFDAAVSSPGGASHLSHVYSYDASTAEYEKHVVRAGPLVPGVNPWTLAGMGLVLVAAGAVLLGRRRVA